MADPLRILSLGAHDAYVERYVADHHLGPVHVDGIELNSEAVERAHERMKDVSGTFALGAAEDAPELFEPGSYDAVVAFELIEHVPDPDGFLSACERMVRPTGRIYISTPAGTFGEGGNPHHLRTYRSIDLVDLLRRRGRLCDATVGSDGIATASYTPAERFGDIAIYTGPGWETWSPHDIERRGLGGSETAAVRLAEALSELGWIVTVYGQVEQGCFRDVVFRHHEVFDPTEPRAALITSRLPEVFDRLVRADTTFLWAHDIDFGPRLTPQRASHIDHILGLSRWHVRHLRGRYPFAANKIVQIRNGIVHAYFGGPTQ
ncbi:MAG: methyltransferase domain-containing protein [Thermoanaerobaculia bacterium]